VEHVKNMLANKKKISGFGPPRVTTTEDPRATHLRARWSRESGPFGESQVV